MRTTFIRSKKLSKIMRTTLETKKTKNAHYIRSTKLSKICAHYIKSKKLSKIMRTTLKAKNYQK